MADNNIARDALDKDSRKRLEKLAVQWTESPGESGLLNLTSPDLRLLLEHFEPLQVLLRRIATPAQHTAPTAEGNSSAAPQPATLQAVEQLQTQLQQAQAELQQSQTRLQQAKVELQQAQAELHQIQTDLHQTRIEFNHLTSQCQAAQHDLAASNAAGQKLQQDKEKLQQENKALKQTCKQLEKQLQQAQEQLSAFRAMQKPVPPELALLRSEPDLAQRLDLSDLPSDDTQALIQTVAILAQRENLERLWSALKDRCETENRSASAPERALLQAALAWHNHNWRTRPYRLVEVTPPSAYHFEDHLRSRQTPTGETVAALDLPGIADSSGKPLCKTLVRTR